MTTNTENNTNYSTGVARSGSVSFSEDELIPADKKFVFDNVDFVPLDFVFCKTQESYVEQVVSCGKDLLIDHACEGGDEVLYPYDCGCDELRKPFQIIWEWTETGGCVLYSVIHADELEELDRIIYSDPSYLSLLEKGGVEVRLHVYAPRGCSFAHLYESKKKKRWWVML